MRNGLRGTTEWICLGCVFLLGAICLTPTAFGQANGLTETNENPHAPSPLSSMNVDPKAPKYYSSTINPNQFVTHRVDLKRALEAYSRHNQCSMNDAFDALAKRLQMVPRDAVNQKVPSAGNSKLRRPDALAPIPGQEKLRNAIYQIVEKDVYAITARQVFFNELQANLHQFQYGDEQIVIEVRFVSVPTKDVGKLQLFMIPNTFTAYENQLPQVIPMATYALANPANKKLDSAAKLPASPTGTYVSATETKTKAFPTFMGLMTSKGLKQLVDHCKGRSETHLIQAPTVTMFPGTSGTVADAAMRPFVVSVKPVKVGQQVEYQPVIQMVEDGVKLAFKADSEGGKVNITGDLIFSSIPEVETFEYPNAVNQQGESVKIQIPEHHVRRVHWATSIESGKTLLIDPVETFEQQIRPKSRFKKAINLSMRKVILVTPRIIEKSE